jgi:lactoylglutathione lyase
VAVPQSHSFGLKLFRKNGNSMRVMASGNVSSSVTASSSENLLEWVKQDKRRLLHVVYRVGDMDRTIKYVFIIATLISLSL